MLFSFNLYSGVLLITFVHAIVYSILILLKARRFEDAAGYWLSLFLLLCSLYICPWMLGFAGWYDNQPYRDILLYFPCQQMFFTGPVIYFYTRSLLYPEAKLKRIERVHFIPGLLYNAYVLAMWLFDRFIYRGYYFYKRGVDRDFDDWFQLTGLLALAFYFILSLRVYNQYKKRIYDLTSFADQLLFGWVRRFLLGFLIMILLPVIFEIAGQVAPEVRNYEGSWWHFLFFSVITYYLAVAAYSTQSRAELRLYFVSDEIPLPSSDSSSNIANNGFTDAEIKHWKQKINEVMEGKLLFRNPNLMLTDLSHELNLNTSLLSKVINEGHGMNFNDLVNSYRIEAVIRSFEAGTHRTHTLLAIAYDCGFNSKTTFNRAFKKRKGLSPQKFLQSRIESPGN